MSHRSYPARDTSHLPVGTFLVNRYGLESSEKWLEIAEITAKHPTCRWYFNPEFNRGKLGDGEWERKAYYHFVLLPGDPLHDQLRAVEMRTTMGIADEDQPEIGALYEALWAHEDDVL